MRTKVNAIAVLALVALLSPLATLAQDETPQAEELDLSTEAGLLAFQDRQAQATAEDVGLPEGFALELVANGLSFPSAVAVAADGTLFAALSGFGGTPAQVVLVNPDGTTAPVVDAAAAGLTPPITDIEFGPDGTFYVAAAGTVAVVDLAAGAVTPILTGLPSLGDHQNNQLAFADEWVYFGQGTATNSMVVGPDNLLFGWLPLFPDVSDIPCEGVTIAGPPFESPNVLTLDNPNDVALTSPYQPFNVAVDPGTTIEGAVPCSGAILRFQPADPVGTLEVFAWGFRNPYGVVADPDGGVWVVNNGPDVRGSRPITDAPDDIWRVEEGDAGTWYGYPDFVAGTPVTDERFAAEGPRPLEFVLANHDELLDGEAAPPTPVATLEPHFATGQAELAPEGWGELAGGLLVASHGDFGPVTGAMERRGHAVVVVDRESGEVTELLANPEPHEPTGAVARPVGLATGFDGSLYVADLGIIEATTAGLLPRPNTGAIWRVIPAEVEAATPVVETPAVETPAVETPAVETPAVETPAVETPAVMETPPPVATPEVTGGVGTPAAGAGEAVAVSLTEFAIDMPTELPAGPTTFNVTNDGTIEHSIEVEGQGIEEELEPHLQPGESGTLEVDLAPGTYEVYCPVGNHREQGMRLELTVTG